MSRRASLMTVGAIAASVALHAMALDLLLVTAAVVALLTATSRVMPVRLAIAILPVLVSGWVLLVAIAGSPWSIGFHPLVVWTPMFALSVALLVRAPDTKFGRPDTRGLLPVLAGLSLFVVLAAAAVAPVGADRALEQRVGLMAGAEDMASHYSVARMLDDRGRMLWTGPDRRASELATYPPAFHATAVAVARSSEHTLGNDWRRGGLVDVVLLLWFSTFAWMCTAVGLVAAEFGRTVRLRGATVAGALLTLVLGNWLAFELLRNGFVAQMAALGLALVAWQVMIWYSAATAPRRWIRHVPTACFVASCWTWYLLAPALLVAVAAWHAAARDRRALVVLALTAPAAMLPIWIHLAGSRVGDVVTTSGGIAPVSAWVVVALGIVGALAATSAPSRRIAVTWTLPAACVLTSLALWTWQTRSGSGPSYFYFKQLYSSGVLLSAGLVAAAGVAAPTPLSGRSAQVLNAVRPAALMLVVALLVGLVPGRGLALWQQRIAADPNANLAPYAAAIGEVDVVRDHYVVAWGGLDTVRDYRTTRWLNAVFGQVDPDMFEFTNATVLNQNEAILREFARRHPGEVIVVTTSQSLAKRAETWDVAGVVVA